MLVIDTEFGIQIIGEQFGLKETEKSVSDFLFHHYQHFQLETSISCGTKAIDKKKSLLSFFVKHLKEISCNCNPLVSFVCDINNTVPNHHILLQKFKRRNWGTLIFGITLWNLAGVGSHYYLIVINKEFVIHIIGGASVSKVKNSN